MGEDLHPQARAAIARRSDEALPQSHALSIATYREQFRESLIAQSNESVEAIRDFDIPGPRSDIPIRVYHPGGEDSLPVVAFFHGGGWVLGDLDCFDNLCTHLANRAGCIVVSVGYRRAPEHPFPAAAKDCYAATEWVAANAADIGGDPDRVAVAGNSAGGNLATVVALMARDRDGPDVGYQVLLYPVVNAEPLRAFESYEAYGSGYSLTMGSMRRFYEAYVPDPVDHRNAYAFPLHANDLSGSPPATVLSAEYDLLRDEAFAYADRLRADGVPVEHHHYDTMIHDFVCLTDEIDAAVEGIERIADDLTDALER
jgi:acetyl esterase